jgi:hypothetical protein
MNVRRLIGYIRFIEKELVAMYAPTTGMGTPMDEE